MFRPGRKWGWKLKCRSLLISRFAERRAIELVEESLVRGLLDWVRPAPALF
jgi:hypothetical protein